MLRYGNGSFVIKVNSAHIPTRQNFSSAHEMGHILLSELGLESRLRDSEFRTRRFNPQVARKSRNKARERLCDVAASELLMPEDVFKRHLSETSIGSLEGLADMFGTSRQTTAIRIAEVSPTPCVALLWKPQKASNSMPLRLEWHVGPGRPTSRSGRYFPVTESAAIGGSVYEAFRDGKIVKSYKEFKTRFGTKRLRMESKAYGSGATKYVISLAFETGKSNPPEDQFGWFPGGRS
ncbi:MAG: ImmA/IrrE family metallo-endopeptidase [Chloroflexi bacterium]|nr:ImmA/IrrE family metallo-endopeptidase [Chloroflexota bacterium]